MNKRVKHQSEIGLPLSDLWKLYVESSSAPIVRNFCVMYIEMAVDRVQKEVGIPSKSFTPSIKIIEFLLRHETAGKTIDGSCFFSQHFEVASPTSGYITQNLSKGIFHLALFFIFRYSFHAPLRKHDS